MVPRSSLDRATRRAASSARPQSHPIHMATLLLALPAIPLDAGGPRCALADARAQAACEINHRPGKRERHLARMAKCDFKAKPRIQLLLLSEGPIRTHAPDRQHVDPRAGVRGARGQAARGTLRASARSPPGGNSWIGVTTVHDESMHAQWRVSHEGRASLFVGDHVLGSADASGELIGYPPIHQHHWHYFHASDFGRDFLSVHGDQDCAGRDGAYCTLVEYPNGSAFELVPQLGIMAEFNDVRPSGAPPLEWYAFGGLFIHDPAIPKPRGMHWANLQPFNLNAPRGHRGTNLFDTAREHVTWATGTLPTVDYVVDSYFHAHPDMVDDIWVIGAPASRLGLLSPPWIAAYNHLKSGPTVIRELKAPRACDGGGGRAHPLSVQWRPAPRARPRLRARDRTQHRVPLLGDEGHRVDLCWLLPGAGRRAPPGTRCIPCSAWPTTPARARRTASTRGARTIPSSTGWSPGLLRRWDSLRTTCTRRSR